MASEKDAAGGILEWRGGARWLDAGVVVESVRGLREDVSGGAAGEWSGMEMEMWPSFLEGGPWKRAGGGRR